MKSELTANQDQFCNAQSTMQLAGNEVEKIENIVSMAIGARDYGSTILDVLQGRAEQNLPAQLTQVTQHVHTVLEGLAIVAEGLSDLRRATTVAEDAVALVAGARPATLGHADIAPNGLTPAVLDETVAFIAEI